MFTDVKKFDDSHSAVTAWHYSNVMKCIATNMFYDLDTGLRVPKRVFEIMIKEGVVGQYSKNPNHPVFASDLSSYQDDIGMQVCKFGSDLDQLVIDLNFFLQESEDKITEFAQALYFVSPELIEALRSQPQFLPIMSRRDLWEEMIRFDLTLKGRQVRIPAHFFIDRYYMHLISPKSDYFEENLIHVMTKFEMEARALQIASEQEVGSETVVSLISGVKKHNFIIMLTSEGYALKTEDE